MRRSILRKIRQLVADGRLSRMLTKLELKEMEEVMQILKDEGVAFKCDNNLKILPHGSKRSMMRFHYDYTGPTWDAWGMAHDQR